MSELILKNITKTYNEKTIIEDFNLEITNKQFVVFLGPSGCGKSTLLKIIAGLESIDKGNIIINDVDVTNELPKNRNISMVFQNYALYPHMTVFKNISVSLELKKIAKEEIIKRVNSIAKILHIEDLLTRKPKQLSGGQMQRVALARAMIKEPQLFLMDEPLSNLDTKLRVKTRSEIMKLYQKLQTTTLYVTHDQVEAMTMADTIILINNGKVEQSGTPDELYNNPKNIFVAEFIGNPQINLIPYNFFDSSSITLESVNYKEGIIGIRPEFITITNGNKFTVELIENLGSEKFIYITANSNEKFKLVAKCDINYKVKIGDEVGIAINETKLHIFDKHSALKIN